MQSNSLDRKFQIILKIRGQILDPLTELTAQIQPELQIYFIIFKDCLPEQMDFRVLWNINSTEAKLLIQISRRAPAKLRQSKPNVMQDAQALSAGTAANILLWASCSGEQILNFSTVCRLRLQEFKATVEQFCNNRNAKNCHNCLKEWMLALPCKSAALKKTPLFGGWPGVWAHLENITFGCSWITSHELWQWGVFPPMKNNRKRKEKKKKGKNNWAVFHSLH